MTHTVYGYSKGKPFTVLSRGLHGAPRQECGGSDGSMLWRTTEQLRAALELLSADKHHGEQHKFITELLHASLEDGGVWVRFS